MNKRIYNVFFDTHTVAGIVISVALYVIFFAGTISFLKNEIVAWERNDNTPQELFHEADFDKIITGISKTDTLDNRELSFRSNGHSTNVYGFLSPKKDKDDKKNAKKIEEKGKKKGKRGRDGFFSVNLKTGEKQKDYDKTYSLGEFFYRLHFFAQLNFWGRSGYIFAGFISLFFLFTLITGLIIHWDKIISSFYVFRPNSKWKTVWTDAHVSLGFISLPYQFMFALTGCYFIFASILVDPAIQWFQKDQSEAIAKNMYEDKGVELPLAHTPINKVIAINPLVDRAKAEFPDMVINEIKATNWGDRNMYLTIKGHRKYEEKFTGSYTVAYRVSDGKIIQKTNDAPSGYRQGLINVVTRLHFGDFGGYGIRALYIILGFIGCFVIISGVLVWFVARDKKATSEKKRKQNKWVLNIYLSVCLTMLPVTALTFCIIKLFGENILDKKEFIFHIFFWSWLVGSVFFVIKKNPSYTNKVCLLAAAVLSLLVPICDGIVTNNWLWISLMKGEKQIFMVNFFWLSISVACFYVLKHLDKSKHASFLSSKN